jgi:hypothetical protein
MPPPSHLSCLGLRWCSQAVVFLAHRLITQPWASRPHVTDDHGRTSGYGHDVTQEAHYTIAHRQPLKDFCILCTLWQNQVQPTSSLRAPCRV